VKNQDRKNMIWLLRWTGTTKQRIENLAQRLGIQFDDNGTVSAEDAHRISREHQRFNSPSTPVPDYSESRGSHNPWVSFTQGGRPESNRRKH
jgi:hypothetical protein